tara:strand:- start:2120 stop:2671 length:552 start_codon:yes stop_codon:yes gene_type:complete
MENKSNYYEEVVKGGIMLAAVSIIITMLTYIINIEIMVEWWFGLISLAISISLLIYIGIGYRNSIGGILSYGNAFKFSFLVMAVSFVIGIGFQILLYTVIDPSLPEVITQLTVEKTIEMMESFGTSQEIIDASIEGVEEGVKNSTTASGILKSSPWGLLFLGIFSLITAFFIKKNETISDRIN